MKRKGIMRCIVLLLSSFLLMGAISCTDDNTNSSSSNTIIGGDTSCEHNWTDWTQDQEATCKTTGLKSRSCTLCEAKEEKVIEKSVHKYNSENICEYCASELVYTAGLAYEKSSFHSAYFVVGLGTATETDIVIPAYHAGTRVRGIAKEAFYGNDQITSVTAPSIIEIEQDAFYYCAKLHSVEFNSVESIGYGAFKDCKKLNKITLSKTKLEIRNNSFLGTDYFNNDKNWKNKALYIGAHLISVKEDYEENTFTIKSGTLSVADYAFKNVSAIETIQFPENELLIGSCAFTGCDNWEEFEVTENIELIDYSLSGTSLTKLVAPAEYVIASIVTITNSFGYFDPIDIEIPTSLKTLIVTGSSGINANYSFSNFTQLEHLEHNFRHHGNVNSPNLFNAYSGLTKLKTLKMPGFIRGQDWRGEFGQHIGECFSSTYFEGSVAVSTYVDDKSETYYFPSSLKEITIDGGYIAESMFYGCDNFQSITIKNILKYDEGNMGDDALCNVTCENLTIDNSISKLSDIYVYKNGEYSIGVKNFYYLGTLQEWWSIKEKGSFRVDNIYINGQKMEGTLTLPEGMKEIPERAFSGFKSLTGITIPDSVTSIGNSAFSVCSGLTSIVIPDSVTSIGNSAFSGCSGLTSIVIPDSVTSIGNSAFYNCSSLTDITIPDSVTSIGNKAFRGCSGLTSIVIPDSVTSIGEWAFCKCSSLTSVMIGGSVESIYCDAFDGCSSLTSVYISNIEAWCDISFGNLTANPLTYAKNLYLTNELVTELKIPNTVTEIKAGAFYNCSSLTSITIPDSVTSIGDSAFYNCYRLVEVINKSTHITVEKRWEDNGYIGSYALAVYNSGDTFTGTKLSNDNGYIVYTDGEEKILVGYMGTETDLTLPSYITKINNWAFYNCSSLTSITIPDSVTSIGDSAFYNCSSLTSITIPDGVTSIGEDAFRGCSGLTSIVIPDSVTSISYSAFYNCSSLTIFCEATTKPNGWVISWNSSNCPVIWGYKE